MAKTNYPEELVALVEEYLTDGIISSKERQVLLKKAQQFGVDADEFDLYIDAQQQKTDQVVDAAAAKKRGKTCPFCGGTVPQLADKCPHCGEILTAEASEELQEIFDHLEEALVDFKSGKDIAKSKATVERYVRKAKMYYENNPKVQKLLAEVQEESDKAEAAAKKNARNKTIISILTYNKKITAGVIVLLIALIGWVIWSFNPTYNANACNKAVTEALEDGDPDEAKNLYENFSGHSWDLGVSKDDIARGYLKKGQPEKAIAFLGKGDLNWAGRTIYGEIEKSFIEKGEYDAAIDVYERSGYTSEDNYRILCLCIDKIGKNNTTEIKNLYNLIQKCTTF